MNLSKLAVKRPVTTAMVVLMVVLVGFVSLINLPQDLMPKVEMPVALVMVQYPNASPEEIETMITKPMEQQLAAVEDIDTLMSITSQGSSMVMVQFKMDTDMNFAALNMREKLALITGMLPEEAGEPMVLKMDMNAMPIVQIYVSGNMPLPELNNIIQDNVVPQFERVGGVASVSAYGGVEEEISIAFEQDKLSGYGFSLAQISQMLAAENINLPSGDISKGNQEVIVRTLGEFQSVDDLKRLPVPLSDRSVIQLQDLATIEQRYKDQESISRIDEKTSIALAITKQSDANSVEVSNDVAKTVDSLSKKYPELNFVTGFDQSDFIKSSIASVAQSAILGGLLAILVIFLFLRNISATLIIAISIPTSFFATFTLMKALGMTLNMITLCALTLAVGMLVDNSVVVLENIFRINQLHHNPRKSSIMGSKEIYTAVIASTLTSLVVYLPIAVSGGISAMMFKDFCYTIIVALLASLIVSLSVVPMLSSKILKKEINTNYIRVGNKHYKYKLIPYFSRTISYITLRYEQFIAYALHKRKRILVSCVAFFVLSCSLVGMVGMELLPATDEGSFSVSVDMPYGTSLAQKDKMITKMENYIMDIPELSHCTVDVGQTSMFSSAGASLSVTLVDKTERDRSTDEIVKEVKDAFKNTVGAEVSVSETSSMGAMSGGADMSLTIKGTELTVLEKIGNDLVASISEIPGVSEASLDLEEGNPEVKVLLNRNAASHYGINAYQLANGLSESLTGKTATKLKMNGEEIEVNLSLSDTYSDSVENMKQILITSPTGEKVPVGQIAEFEYDNSPSVINRMNQQRFINVNLSIDGRDLGSVSKDALDIVTGYSFPDGYAYETGGQQDQMMEAFGSLLTALIVAIVLVYLLLASQFESLILPLMVMVAIPFSMSGAFMALFITGKALSMPAFIALIMLIGIVVNNSILLIEFITQNKTKMPRDTAIVQAGKVRLRPILMTTLTTCVGMIPMSLGLGDGGEVLAPMGIAVIGGLLASTIVSLILIPILYAIVDDASVRKVAKKIVRDAHREEIENAWLAKQEVSHEQK